MTTDKQSHTEDTPTPDTEYIVKLHNAHTGKVVEIPLPEALSAGYFSLEYNSPDIKKIEVVKVSKPKQDDTSTPDNALDNDGDNGSQDDKQLRETLVNIVHDIAEQDYVGVTPAQANSFTDKILALFQKEQFQLVSELIADLDNFTARHDQEFVDKAKDWLEHKKQELEGKS